MKNYVIAVQVNSHAVRRFTMACCLLLALFVPTTAMAQEVVRVTGQVISKEKRKPLMGVNIIDVATDRLLTTTDEDGRFAINVLANGTLRFTMIGAKARTVKVKSLNNIAVELDERDIELGEATVTGKRIKDKVTPEPTSIEVIGNYFHIKTRVRVPREMFAGNTRLVIQPILNNATRKKLIAMKPMVYDAREYNETQDRMYDDDLADRDPLAKYITVKSSTTREKGRTNDIIGYRDSIYVENVKDEFSCDVYMAIEDYDRIRYRDTTIIARGTVNPLRFLDYKFEGKQVTDSAYYPKAEMQLRDSRGDINLRFAIGRSELDVNNAQNHAELSALDAQLKAIANSKDASLRAFAILGTASPDGRYSSNLKLAERRMQTALNYIVGQLDSKTRRQMQVSSKASVAGWGEVVKALRHDTLNKEADAVEAIIRQYGDRDRQSAQIRRLPFYRSLLEGKYLPRLRRVSYELNYSIFRFLTIEEIKELYAKDYKQLSRYEFFRLYRAEPDAGKREGLIRQALEIYPSFMIAANDLQAILIEKGQSDANLLRPFAGKDAPTTLNVNHIIASLDHGRYEHADSIADFVPTNSGTRLIKAITAALNGRYEESYETIAETGQRNEALMLLAMKDNERAAKLSTQLPDSLAISHYVRAICLNRLEKPVEAYKELKQAFRMDPALEKIAPLDGDVNDLILDK